MSGFGKKIRAARMSLGYTQTEFAELLGASYRTIQEWEGGRKTPRYAHLILAAAKTLPKSRTPRAGRPGRKPRKKGGR